MSPIRVLVVDDSVVVRKILCEILGAIPTVEVVGTAPNGSIGLAKVAQLKPDLVTLDIEMPLLDGLQTLTEIRKLCPRLPVLMCSTMSERGASVTLEALALGATDYVTKPANSNGMGDAWEQLKQELTTKILAIVPRAPAASPAAPLLSPPSARKARTAQRIDVLAVGASTGGPNALAELIPQLPADFPVPVVLVQHMPPLFTRLLAQRLDARAPLAVHEAEPGVRLEPGHIWIAPGNFHMTVARTAAEVFIQLNQDPPENSCRPAVDVLFRSVAHTYRAGTLAVVLTGMGSDGTRGAQAIREAGGEIMVQDEATSVVWGMPGSIAGQGLADLVRPLHQIAGEVIGRVNQLRAALRPTDARLSAARGMSS